jgi:hypothetical protein
MPVQTAHLTTHGHNAHFIISENMYTMNVTIHGRTVTTEAEPIQGGVLVKLCLPDSSNVFRGSVIEVEGKPHAVVYLLRFTTGEPEAWLILKPVAAQPSKARKER